jgi:preprotein translocase subunit SecG
MTYLFMFLLFFLALILILLVLIQRGKGGGLAGAFGGMGGQSAFGTKAGDLFTRITIGVAAVWILVCIISVKYAASTGDRFSEELGGSAEAREGFGTAPGAEGEPAAPGGALPAGEAEGGGGADSGGGQSPE